MGKQTSDSNSDKGLLSDQDQFYKRENISIFNDFRNSDRHYIDINTTLHNGESKTELYDELEAIAAAELYTVKNTSDAKSLTMPTTGIDREGEASLIRTCAGRCGEESLFPCSCSALCVVYDTCCENFTQDCPHILQGARYGFGDLIESNKYCSEDSVFLISSCPKQSESHKQIGKAEGLLHQKTDMIEGDLRENLTDAIFHQATEVGSTILALEGSQESVAKRLKTAALRAPVTDASSGITYTNRTVYDCHKHKTDTFFVWALKLHYVKTNPQSLEDLKDLKHLDRYEPLFNSAILSRHSCLNDVVNTCPKTWVAQEGEEHYATRCLEYFALTVANNGIFAKHMYRNRFCAYCNKGMNHTYALRDKIVLSGRDNHLRMLMTIEPSGKYTIKVRHPTFFDLKHISWSQVSCKLLSETKSGHLPKSMTNISPEERSVCSAKCSSSSFTLRQDGYCKAPYVAKVAVSDDGLPPLCSRALQGIARFISCGLQSMINSMPHSEFHPVSISAHADTQTNNTLYLIKIKVDLVYPHHLFFSSSEEDSMINWRHLEILAKSLKQYRLSTDLCAVADSQDVAPERNQVKSSSFEKLVRASRAMRSSFDLLQNISGPVVSTDNTTTFCMSAINLPIYYEVSPLPCRETFVYTNDAKAMAEFHDSPCFSHLDNLQPAKSEGSHLLNHDIGSVFHGHWLLTTGLGFVVVTKLHG
ncbi:hypothetical protein EGW08_017940 [Elysia chlorotica]|uniref:SMB domain-containing protein n=1 Tax=Elysia chlorotica TaxID=188477 RepID=A0A3S0ZC45_ELYCH|nr:hypothetical protein EGW08_017940 [Elysia chlorotica]